MTNCDDYNDGTGLTVTWEGQYVEFRWRKTEGTKRHTLKLRHVKNRQHLIIDADVYHDSHKCKIEDYIRYGQVYEMMIEFVWPNDEKRRHSGWKKFILGGKIVPVYPSARLNRENPQRSVILTWTNCETTAAEYRIKAIPSTGQMKTYTCSDCTMTIKQLKSNTEYTFEVQALFEDNNEGPVCKTEKLSTRAKSDADLTTQSYKNMTGCTLHITNPTSVQHSHITKVTDPDFGKVRNVEMITRDENGVEMAMVQWEEPLFHGERDDYEILQYKVTVKEGRNKIRDWNCREHCTDEFMINLGKLYIVSITTHFQEIDTEKRNCADFKEEIYSRPTIPEIQVAENINSVLVEWLCESGAEEYRLEVYKSNSLALAWDGSRSFKDKEIDKKKLNLGTSYKFRVIAFAKGRKSNDSSISLIIGGDHVVRNARASLSKDNPFDSIDISWQSPEIPPTKYKVRDANSQNEVLETEKEQCTVTGLLSGVQYQFEVIAVYNNYDGHPAKTDCVTTDPRPERISKVVLLDGQRPDTCIHLNWTPSKSATKYKIRALCSNTVLEHTVKDEKYVLQGLNPDTLYKIYVSAGNNEGFSEETILETTTEIQVPVDVTLTWDERLQTLQATCGGGEGLEEIWEFFKSVGNLYVESESSKLMSDQFEGNTEYYATVKFKRGKKESRTSRSNTLLTVPPEVRDVKASRGKESPSTDIHIEWIANEGLSYELEFETDHDVEAIIRSNYRKASNTGKCRYRCLQEGNEYSARVRAQNATGYGKWSQKVYVCLAPPRIKDLAAINTKDHLTIHWKKPATESLTILHYILKVCRPTAENCEPDIKVTMETRAEISPYVPGETYKFSVAAVNSNNVTGEYESGSVITDGLSSPEYILVEPTNPTKIYFKWPENRFADSYLITCGEVRHETDQTSWMFTDARPKTEYTVRVFSKRGSVLSESSANEQFITGDLCPIMSESIEIEKDIQEPWRFVTVKWKGPPGATQFKVAATSGAQNCQEIICEQNFIRLEHTSSNRRLHVKIFPAVPGVVSSIGTSKSIIMPEIPSINQDSIKVLLDEEYPWKYANIQWELPTAINRAKLTVEPFDKSSSTEMLLDATTEDTTVRFERKSGISMYIVKIQSGYYPDVFCNEITEQNFTMADIPAVNEDDIKVILDDVYPWQYANIQWKLPPALECSILTIGSDPALYRVHTAVDHITQDTSLRFERILDISQYVLKIRAGFNSNAFSKESTTKPFVMGPDCPNQIRIEQVNDPRSKFLVYMEREDLFIDKMIVTASSECGIQKAYEYDWESFIKDESWMSSSNPKALELTDLPPGQTYKLYIETSFESHRRPKMLIGHYELRPSLAQQLEANCTQRNALVLKWIPHEDPNTNYCVRGHSTSDRQGCTPLCHRFQ